MEGEDLIIVINCIQYFKKFYLSNLSQYEIIMWLTSILEKAT